MYRSTKFHLPILEITDEGMLAETGDFTVCFEVIRPPVFTLSAGQLETIHQSWVKALRALPYGTIVHIQDTYFEREWDILMGTGGPGFLGSASDDHFHGLPYLDGKCHCYITKRAPGNKYANSGLSTLLEGSIVPEYVRDPKLLQPFLDQCGQFQTIMKDSKLLELRSVTARELQGTQDTKGVLEQFYLASPADDPDLGDIAFGDDINIQNRACVIYTLSDAERLPAQCSPSARYEPYSTSATNYPIGFASFLGPLLNKEHFYNQYIFLDDPKKTLAEMETRRRRLKSLSAQSRENAVASEAIGHFLEEAASGQRLPVKAHFNVIAWDYESQKLSQLKRLVSSAITRLGAIPYQETVGAPQIWWAGIPGNAGQFPMNDTFDTFAEQAACFFVPEKNDQSSVSPFGLRLGDRLTGCPLHVDISDEPMRKEHITNRNKFILGGSGSGKSFFTNHLVRSYHDQGAHIVLVDVGGSYKGLCDMLGGQYFAYSDNQPIRFNPFRLEQPGMPDTEKKESIKALLLTLWKKSDEAFTRSEYVALSNALQGYYHWLADTPQLTACFDSFYEFLRDHYAPILADERVKNEDFDMDNFLYVLKPYYKGGEYDYLLNATDQPGLLGERLIIFELDNIKDHPILFPVVTIIIMEVFISKMRQLKGVRKVILIEEAWKAIAKEGMSEYIKYVFKTVRKFFGEAIVVTQDIEDIISSPVVKNAIINNADCKILLDQSKFLHRFDQVQELLGLTDHDKAMVLSLNKANDRKRKYKEVFIGLANGPSKVYRTEVSMTEYLTYTTEESEKVRVDQYCAKHGGREKGLKALVRDLEYGVVKLVITAVICMGFLLTPNGSTSAQVLEIIDAAVKKALVAADLQVQRLQTQTIALENAEKALENSMAGGLLDDITGWVQQQENLYGAYYQELWQVKTAFSSYSKVATLIQRQTQLVRDEQQAWSNVQKDPHFSAAELQTIGSVYSNILDESACNVKQLGQVIEAFVTQMDDAGRLRIIDDTGQDIDRNTRNLGQWTQENALLSLQRAKDEDDLLTIKALYNIP